MCKVSIRFVELVGATVLLLTLTACGRVGPKHATLERKVMTGYQGWFRTPDDGAAMGWSHYQKGEALMFDVAQVRIDYWPDVSELGPDEKFPTALRHSNGSVAQLFSSHHPRTVERHFRWMRDYGIDGAFIQRWPNSVALGTPDSQLRLRAEDNVLQYARNGAERYDRSFALMYDLTGLSPGAIDSVKRDWQHVVNDLRVRQSSAYQHHRGRPLVAVWGIGFNDRTGYTLSECAELIDFLKSDSVYGNNTVMLGVPTGWRTQTRDSIDDPALLNVLQLADVLSPWTPGRYRTLAGVHDHAERYWAPDRLWCAERGIDYVPVVFPGFSWHNLTGATDPIDRLDGRFLWEQYRQLANRGFNMIYQAMFDEMDEGTQIFKTASSPPIGVRLLSYAPLPSDHYLWLVGEAAEFVRTQHKMPERIVNRKGHPTTNEFLRRFDDRIYAEIDKARAAREASGGVNH